ncbi:hypothetical protein H7J88_16755 [Mycolicibacterium flavescens]|uniref:hypothetical protein n=1 Tax=Mycolicibacterium flavescens TaxID=1776 RepID=UPI0013F4C4CC|nr:hypothetical protein [Mycolicibacterium flavescens]MCV7281292.1 hypothetical protein [Mycolicibacterium flavescens]
MAVILTSGVSAKTSSCARSPVRAAAQEPPAPMQTTHAADPSATPSVSVTSTSVRTDTA